MRTQDYFTSDDDSEHDNTTHPNTLTTHTPPPHPDNNSDEYTTHKYDTGECLTINDYHGNKSRPKLNEDLNIVGHNINGMRGDDQKFKLLLEYCTAKNIDIIGISETNISQQEGEYWNIDNND